MSKPPRISRVASTFKSWRAVPLVVTALGLSTVHAAEESFCGPEGVWVQILGSGGLDLDNQRAAPSYLVWVDDKARLMVDAGSGAALRFDESGAEFKDLDALVFTHLHADRTGDFVSLIGGSRGLDRERPVPVLGPTGNESHISVTTFVERLIGPDGAYPHLADFLTFRSEDGYKVSVREVPATGNRTWSRFNNRELKLSAIPVHHAEVPALAWRVEIGGYKIVFAGDFNNLKNVVAKFAADADALIVTHALPEGARGAPREAHNVPSQIGRIAAAANARILILGGRTKRTYGVETQTTAAIEESFEGSLIFGGELECWGL